MLTKIFAFVLLLNLIFIQPTFAQETPLELLPLILAESSPSPLKSTTIIRKLAKASYSAKDKITFVVSEGQALDTQIKIFNPDGQEVIALLETIHRENPAVITLTMPAQFKSGRYRAIITAADGTSSSQDFLWGVLAINPDQSVYTPDSFANFSIAVLDETGLMVCDAKVNLEIKTPSGNIDTLPVQVSPVFSIKDFTLTPDYSAAYKLNAIGIYRLTLTAETKNGTYSITDQIEVKERPDFIIKRTSATRIFPPKTYPMLLDITFNASFSGQIIESVPSVFAISSGSNPYNQIELATSSATTRVLNIPELHLPFDGVYPISQTFGSQSDDQMLAQKYQAYGVVGHDGTDFALPMDTPILVVDDGVVVMADPYGPYGQTIVIEHSWGRSYYGHLSQITTIIGSKRPKGHPIGLSGNSGLSTGPHLHLSIKPNNSDPDNGYYGKVNPLPYLGTITTENGLTYTTGYPGDSNSVTKLIWNIDAQAGDQKTLDYKYQVPNISPQFYLVGPLQIGNYQEPRQWQLAIDADGSGSNTVTPNIGEISTTGNVYNFIYTATETMDSGGITVTVPSGWTDPTSISSVTTSGNATIANIITASDSETPSNGNWNEDDQDMCGNATSLNAAADIVVDTTNKIEGTGSIQCASTGTASDAGDSWGFDFSANQNWTTACNGGTCTQISYWVRAASATENTPNFQISSTTDVEAGNLGMTCPLVINSANTWEYKTCSLAGQTLTTVRSLGFSCSNPCNPFDAGVVNIDEILVGPGSSTFTGSGPWDITLRFLDMANTETITLTYGTGAGVTNSSTAGSHIFTTKSKTLVSGAYSNLGSHPFITLVNSNANLMRHGKWFNSSNIIQPFAF